MKEFQVVYLMTNEQGYGVKAKIVHGMDFASAYEHFLDVAEVAGVECTILSITYLGLTKEA